MRQLEATKVGKEANIPSTTKAQTDIPTASMTNVSAEAPFTGAQASMAV